MKNNTPIPTPLLVLLLAIGINVAGSYVYTRFDLTKDNRYTLSEAAKNTTSGITSPMIIDVFLEGDFPAEFKKLQNETRYLLEEFQAHNPNIRFSFSNPVDESTDAQTVARQFSDFGMQPTQLTVVKNGKESVELLFPWATVNYNDKAIPVGLLKNKLGATREELVQASIQNLEFAFAEAFKNISQQKQKRIAVLKGKGELPDGRIADLFRKLQESYYIAPFPMDVAATAPEKAIQALQNTFDLIVVAKPTKAFTDIEKLVLDQYIMDGGNALWLIDAVAMENDSLYTNEGVALAFPRELNLDDLFFRYGARIESKLIQDLYAAPLTLATGDGSASQYTQLPWFYQPLVTAQDNHPISTNIEKQLKFKYASPITLLNNNTEIRKTPLLQSSLLTKLTGVPTTISLEAIGQEPDPQQYGSGSQNIGVLLEGKFTSVFKNRILPVKLDTIRFRESAQKPSKQVIISDGDFIANEMDRNGQPLELGFDKFTFTQYGNKEFLLNTFHYLLDDTGLINIRSKEIALPFLDRQKTASELGFWQVLCIGLPLGLLALFGVGFTSWRKRRYGC